MCPKEKVAVLFVSANAKFWWYDDDDCFEDMFSIDGAFESVTTELPDIST